MQLKVVKEEVGRRNEGRLRTALKSGLMQCNESEKERPRAVVLKWKTKIKYWNTGIQSISSFIIIPGVRE